MKDKDRNVRRCVGEGSGCLGRPSLLADWLVYERGERLRRHSTVRLWNGTAVRVARLVACQKEEEVGDKGMKGARMPVKHSAWPSSAQRRTHFRKIK